MSLLRQRAGRIVLSAIVVGAVAVACLAPTQITLRVVTDVDCAKIASHQVAIYSGDPKTTEPIAVTGTCSPQGSVHEVGSLVLIPSGDVDTPIDVTVIAGVDGLAMDCATKNPVNCIRARRRLHFVPSEPLELPLELALVCQGKVCDPDLTCFRGECVSIDVERASGSRCVGPECSARGELPAPDAALDEAGVAPDAASDGDATLQQDAPPPSDAFLPREVLPRGLTLYAGEIWWTEPVADDPSRTNIVSASASGPAGQPGTVLRAIDLVAYGIERQATEIYCGGSTANTTNCMATVSTPTGFPAPITSCDGQVYIGVALIGIEPYVVGPSGAMRADSSSISNNSGGYYAEPYGDNGTIVYAADSGLLRWNPSGWVLETLADLPKAMRGVASTKDHWLTSSADGDIYAVTRATSGPSDEHTRKLILTSTASGLTQMEDIVWDAATKTLFAAGVKNGRPGIYKIEGLESSFP